MAAVAHHAMHGHGPLSLMSCVRESSPITSPRCGRQHHPHQQHHAPAPAPAAPAPEAQEDIRHESKKRSFHPLQRLRRIFRRKARNSTQPAATQAGAGDPAGAQAGAEAASGTQQLDPTRLAADATLGGAPVPGGRSLYPCAGLSVSHDSVFLAEPRVQDQSTCSDGSLPSMGSSDLDEESCGAGQDCALAALDAIDLDVGVSTLPLSHSAARHKMAVKPRRTHGAPRRRRSHHTQSAAPALPATPELNEEVSGRSSSPEPDSSAAAPAAASTTPCSTGTPSGTPSQSPDVVLDVPAGRPLSVGLALQLKSASLPPGAALRPSGVAVTRSRSSAAYRSEQPQQGVTTPTAPTPAPRSVNTSTTAAAKPTTEDSSKAKEEFSFFGRLLSRRSGKKKKGERADVPPSVPAPVLPAAAPSYFGLVSSKQEDEREVVPTRRLDEKGRYVAEAHFLTKQQQQLPQVPQLPPLQQSRQRQRLEPITLSRDREDDDDDDESAEVTRETRTTSPLEGVPIPVKPESRTQEGVTRMQISYSSTSPTHSPTRSPPPYWPVSTTTTSDTKIVEVIEKSPAAVAASDLEAARARLRLPGLPGMSAFQQRVAQVASAASETSDELDGACSSFADSINDADAGVRGADSGAAAPVQQGASPSPQDGVDGVMHSAGSSAHMHVMKQFDEEINTAISLTHSEASCAPDSLEPAAAATEKLQHSSDAGEKLRDFPCGRSSSVVFCNKSDETELPSPPARPALVQQHPLPCTVKGKSSSLESIGSFHREQPKLASPMLSRKKANSSDSITSTHPAVTTVLGSNGLSITQRVLEQHNNPTTTPAAHSPVSAPSTPSPLSAEAPAAATPHPLKQLTLVNLPAAEKPDHKTSVKPETVEKRDKSPDRKTDSTAPAQTPETATDQLPIVRLPPLRKTCTTGDVPEFMRVQLNRVDFKPALNVVLSTSGEPDKPSFGLQRRQSVEVLDPWSVDELSSSSSSSSPPPPQPVTLLGLRVKRAATNPNFGDTESPPELPRIATKESATTPPPMSLPPFSSGKPAVRKQPSLPKFEIGNSKKPLFCEDNNNVVIVEKKKTTPVTTPTTPTKSVQDDVSVSPVLRKLGSSRESPVKQPVEEQPQVDSKEQSEKESPRGFRKEPQPVRDGRESASPEVVLRKKSLPREVVGGSRDDTPELMKVFARRSLKVRDVDGVPGWTVDTGVPALAASPPNATPVVSPTPAPTPASPTPSAPSPSPVPPQQTQDRVARSRDSDKENEGGESPKEDRKKVLIGEPKEVTIARPLSAKPAERLRSRNLENGDKPSAIVGKVSARWTLPAVPVQPRPVAVAQEDGENTMPRFKRIQQQWEEMEQRALAAKAGQ